MSRFYVKIPLTDEIKIAFKQKFNLAAKDMSFAWGLDRDGYFIQMSTESDYGTLYLENGLFGTNKNRILNILEMYGLIEFFRENEPENFALLCLDLPLVAKNA